MWRERRRLIDMWRRGNAAALATLVAVEGSSYRKPGARLLVGTDGSHAGTISGGCLEAEVVRKARWLVREGASIQRYSTALDDIADIPYGLGCGGTVHVLLEPAGTPEFERLMHALDRSLQGETFDVYTTLPGSDRPFARVVRSDVPSEIDGPEAGVYLERLDPPQRLIVFGAGDDAQPLVDMAALLGWRTVVVDGRAHLARPERFPQAECVLVADAGTPLDIALGPNDMAVVMTHSFEQDRAWTAQMLPWKLPYLGLLGARHRSALLASEIAEELAWPLDEVCAHLSAPVGLDLGGDGAETVALAILAEMQACASGRPVLSRHMTGAAVAEQMERHHGTHRFPSQCAL